ncbi:MAG: amidohydrolase [Opitutales bacterium]|nr:amidohydrolase [Opitutales bacterium]
MIVDHHIHLFPEACSEDPIAFAEKHFEPHWQDLVAPPGRKSLQGWASVDACLQDMDSAGVEMAWLLGWYWEQADTCRLHNAYYADILQLWPGRFNALACYHPQLVHEEGPDAWVERIWADGFIGVGELLPQVQGFDLTDHAFARVLDMIGERDGWVNFHVTEPVGRTYPGRVDTPLQPFVDLARRHPKTQFILSHLGGGIAFFLDNPVARKGLNNLFIDTAAWPLIYSESAVKAAIQLAGQKRVLYGTDYPLRVFPKLGREQQMKANRERWLSMIKPH